MARIEISMDEYNALKERIRELEEHNGELARQHTQAKGTLEAATRLLIELSETGLVERIFGWNSLIDNIANTLNHKE